MKFKVRLVQNYPKLGDLDHNFKKSIEAIKAAISDKVDLIVFSELALTGYTVKDMVPEVAISTEHENVKELLSKSKDISIAIGYVEESKEYHFYNSALYLEDGKILRNHRKVYLPTYTFFDELRYFKAGSTVRSFDTKFGRIGVLVCEDQWHASNLYILSQDGAQIVIVLANAPGRGISTGAKLGSSDGWENMNRVYARLFSMYVLFVNRVGFEDGLNFWGGSEVIDPEGNEIAKANYFEEEILTATLDTNAIRRARIYSPIMRDESLNLVLDELTRIKNDRIRD